MSMEGIELTAAGRDRRLSLERKRDGNTEITEGRTQRSQRKEKAEGNRWRNMG